MVPQASYLQGENQAGVCGPGLIDRKGLVHLTDPTASSAGSNACGDSSSGGTILRIGSTSYGSWKQEVAHHQVTERLRNGSPPFRRRGNPPFFFSKEEYQHHLFFRILESNYEDRCSILSR
jgi:hypothetical protein